MHVNPTIQETRRGGLIEVGGRRLLIPDLERPTEARRFNPTCLRLDREGRRLDAND